MEDNKTGGRYNLRSSRSKNPPVHVSSTKEQMENITHIGMDLGSEQRKEGVSECTLKIKLTRTMGTWTPVTEKGKKKSKRFRRNGNEGQKKHKRFKRNAEAIIHTVAMEDELNNIIYEQVPVSIVPPVPIKQEKESDSEDEVEIIKEIEAGDLKMTPMKVEIEDHGEVSVPLDTDEETTQTRSINFDGNAPHVSIKEEEKNEYDIEEVACQDEIMESGEVLSTFGTDSVGMGQQQQQAFDNVGDLKQQCVSGEREDQQKGVNGEREVQQQRVSIERMMQKEGFNGEGQSQQQQVLIGEGQIQQQVVNGEGQSQQQQGLIGEGQIQQQVVNGEVQIQQQQGVFGEDRASSSRASTGSQQQCANEVGGTGCRGACRENEKIKIKMEIEMSAGQFIKVAKELPNIVTSARYQYQ